MDKTTRTTLSIALIAVASAAGAMFVASAAETPQQPAAGAGLVGAAVSTLVAPRMGVLPVEPVIVLPDGTEAQSNRLLSQVDLSQVDGPLAPGAFEWHPENAATGELVILVSLPRQEVHVYRDGVRIGRASISTGRGGHETPIGVFPILQKARMHHSDLYDDAPMPFMQRLTWDGVALHAGRNPGYPASHGCIRLPAEFAELLYGVTSRGEVVVVADASMFGDDVLAPGPFAPTLLLATAREALEQEQNRKQAQATAKQALASSQS